MYECSCSQPIQVYVVSLSHPCVSPASAASDRICLAKDVKAANELVHSREAALKQAIKVGMQSAVPISRLCMFVSAIIVLDCNIYIYTYIYIYCIYYVILYALNELQLK